MQCSWGSPEELMLSNCGAGEDTCGEGNGTPLQYSCLENPMDRGAWWAAVHGVAKSQTWLSDFPFTFHFHALEKEMATNSSVLAWRIPGTEEPGGLPSMELQSQTRLKWLSSSSSRRHLRVPWTERRSNQSILKEINPSIHWKDWCWSCCKELTHWKTPWWWEGLRAGGEGNDRRWDGWMTSPTQWTWVWANSGRWWKTGKSGVLQSMRLQRVGHDLNNNNNNKCNVRITSHFFSLTSHFWDLKPLGRGSART